MKILPIGTQTFGVLRNDGAIYVDKTEHIYKLINSGRVYFLSRPRRFGKSLLISTFKELFKGNKKIFEGLYIYDKWDWTRTNPVIHLDFAEI
ncbi:MAG: AAA family ATPase, partial [Endomicrobium sp.]|nr:AAA family ATPase [Endomicrobium sp.]